MQKNKKDVLLVHLKLAILSAISFILMFIAFPIAPFPPFMKMDFSDIPAIIAGIIIGPFGGLAVEFLKNLIDLFKTNTAGIGQLANFIVGASYVLPFSLILKKVLSKKKLLISMIISTISMIVFASIANYYILIPFYSKLMPLESIFEVSRAVSKNVLNLKSYIFYIVVPFNLIKGTVISVITYLIYGRIKKIIEK